jgi:hypothetical protein
MGPLLLEGRRDSAGRYSRLSMSYGLAVGNELIFTQLLLLKEGDGLGYHDGLAWHSGAVCRLF